MTTRLTPEEQAAIENAIADAQVEAQLREIEEEAAERARLEAIRRGLGTYVLGPADGLSPADPAARQPDDVANAMRGERALPDMLHPNWLVRGVLHWIYSDAEAGKTWLALKLALNVMRAGGVVLWSDEELGVKTIADRLLDLGATPEEIEGRLIYLAFSDWTMSEEDRVSWNTLLAVAKPDLVVFDTATDHLVSAGLDEDKGGPVTAWVKAYPEAVTGLGLTTVVLDHTGKSGEVGKHAVGSRAKRAKAKVQYGLAVPRGHGYDRTRIGKVRVTLTKNTLGADLLHGETERTFKVGGDGQGNFTWVHDDTFPAGVSHDDGEGIDRKRRILELLEEEGKPLTKTQITDRVTGRKQAILKDLPEMADSDTWPVRASSSGRSTTYQYVDPDPEKPEAAGTTTPKRKPAAKRKPRRTTAPNPNPKPKVKLRTAVSPSKGKKK